MKIRRYRAYTTLTQVRKKLGMGNKNTLKVEDGVFQPSRQITIKKNPKYIAITLKAEMYQTLVQDGEIDQQDSTQVKPPNITLGLILIATTTLIIKSRLSSTKSI